MTVDDSERRNLENEKTLHQNQAATFFSYLKDRTNLGKTNDEVEVLTFDVEQNLPLSKVPVSEASCERRPWAYNCCIHSGKTGLAHFYLYDETIARESPNEIVSFLYHYVNNVLPKTGEVCSQTMLQHSVRTPQ